MTATAFTSHSISKALENMFKTKSILPVKVRMINDSQPLSDHLLFSSFNQALDVIALEYLEGKARPLGPTAYKGSTLILRAEPDQWSVWLDECEQSFAMPQIIWVASDDGHRGPMYEALDLLITNDMKRLVDDSPWHPSRRIEIHMDISNISSHQKLGLLTSRTSLLG